MTTISGRVEKIYSKEYKPGKFMYSIVVNGTFYGVGGRKPSVAEGDNVQFVATQNGKFWNVDGNVEVLSQGTTPRSSASAPAASPVANDRQLFEERKQDAIALQAARNTALTAAGLLIGNGAIKLPAKPADIGDVVLALVDDLTARYYAEVRGIYEGKGYSPHSEDKASAAPATSSDQDDDIPF